jgi:hypothetical protein
MRFTPRATDSTVVSICTPGRRLWGPRGRAFKESGRWFERDGALVLDGEPSAIDRTLRPILRSVGLACNSAVSYGLEWITPTNWSC